jgi:hypothetical protein
MKFGVRSSGFGVRGSRNDRPPILKPRTPNLPAFDVRNGGAYTVIVRSLVVYSRRIALLPGITVGDEERTIADRGGTDWCTRAAGDVKGRRESAQMREALE